MEKVNGKESKDIFKKYEISELEIKAIDEAFEDITNGKVQSHQEVMKETKKRFPHLFNRCD